MEKNHPRVSVVISTFNRPNKLREAIRSVLNQTFTDFELIVVDDCSPIDPVEVVSEFGDRRINYIRLEKNSGSQAKPKNTGILASVGDYVAFLDDDNAYRLDHLAVLVNALDNNPTVSLVYGDRYMNFENDPTQNGIGIYHDHSPEVLMQRNYIDTSDFMVRREDLFDIGGWDERYKRMLDWNLVARLCKAGRMLLHVPIIITDYNIHKDGMLSDKPVDGEWFVMDLPNGQRTFSAVDVDIELPFLGNKEEPKVAIFTLTYNRLKYTKESFESLHNTAGYSFDHYIVDNGSTDGTVEYLKGYAEKHNAKVIFNEDNKGISIASNQILKVIKDSGIKYQIIGKFDNDAYCKTEGWLKEMVNIWKSNHLIAQSCYISGLRDSAGGVPRYVYGKIKNQLVGMVKHLGGICCFTSAGIRLNFHLDENEPLHTMDDLFFSRYLRERGYQMLYLENFYINHGPEGTEAQATDFPEYFEKRKVEKTKAYGTTA